MSRSPGRRVDRVIHDPGASRTPSDDVKWFAGEEERTGKGEMKAGRGRGRDEGVEADWWEFGTPEARKTVSRERGGSCLVCVGRYVFWW